MVRRVTLPVAGAALTAVLLGGCPGSVASRPRAAAVVASGERVVVPGVEITLYAYPEVIVAYPADDRGGYVVRVEPGPAGAAIRAEVEARGDDLVGDDGHVLRLSASERDALAGRAGVREVSPLPPVDRRPRSPATVRSPTPVDGTIEVRIDLFADVSADEAAAVAAWIAWKGGEVTWRAATALTARLPADAIVLASRLSPVRWVE